MGCCNQADQEKYAELKKFIDSLPTQKGELIRVLHRARGSSDTCRGKYRCLWQGRWKCRYPRYTVL